MDLLLLGIEKNELRMHTTTHTNLKKNSILSNRSQTRMTPNHKSDPTHKIHTRTELTRGDGRPAAVVGSGGGGKEPTGKEPKGLWEEQGRSVSCRVVVTRGDTIVKTH